MVYGIYFFLWLDHTHFFGGWTIYIEKHMLEQNLPEVMYKCWPAKNTNEAVEMQLRRILLVCISSPAAATDNFFGMATNYSHLCKSVVQPAAVGRRSLGLLRVRNRVYIFYS